MNFDVAILYFVIVKGTLPAWLTWFIMLTSPVGFKVSPHTSSMAPISPRSGTMLPITGQFGKIQRLFLFPKTLSQGSRKVEQESAAPRCPWCFSLYECTFALAGFALSGGSGSALAVTSGGHLVFPRDKCGVFSDCFC